MASLLRVHWIRIPRYGPCGWMGPVVARHLAQPFTLTELLGNSEGPDLVTGGGGAFLSRAPVILGTSSCGAATTRWRHGCNSHHSGSTCGRMHPPASSDTPPWIIRHVQGSNTNPSSDGQLILWRTACLPSSRTPQLPCARRAASHLAASRGSRINQSYGAL